MTDNNDNDKQQKCGEDISLLALECRE